MAAIKRKNKFFYMLRRCKKSMLVCKTQSLENEKDWAYHIMMRKIGL